MIIIQIHGLSSKGRIFESIHQGLSKLKIEDDICIEAIDSNCIDLSGNQIFYGQVITSDLTPPGAKDQVLAILKKNNIQVLSH